ncbi:hypothetical protein [Streptomyces sp. G-G2]|uniref:hypothetical protein n=1 Tax=Streptomyces sp. G-G2 TaxID=3046201 RepID=UPI0024BBC0E1|nr:hypothetical protein [Streptomyces sp. G-G2]MDJ0386197.1 hypothetical protein [Streptomyces sp. G-G2]
MRRRQERPTRSVLAEAYRHGMAVGGWSDVPELLDAAGIGSDLPGVIAGDSASAAVEAVTTALAGHRARDRFPPASEPGHGRGQEGQA